MHIFWNENRIPKCIHADLWAYNVPLGIEDPNVHSYMVGGAMHFLIL